MAQHSVTNVATAAAECRVSLTNLESGEDVEVLLHVGAQSLGNRMVSGRSCLIWVQ